MMPLGKNKTVCNLTKSSLSTSLPKCHLITDFRREMVWSSGKEEFHYHTRKNSFFRDSSSPEIRAFANLETCNTRITAIKHYQHHTESWHKLLPHLQPHKLPPQRGYPATGKKGRNCTDAVIACPSKPTTLFSPLPDAGTSRSQVWSEPGRIPSSPLLQLCCKEAGL